MYYIIIEIEIETTCFILFCLNIFNTPFYGLAMLLKMFVKRSHKFNVKHSKSLSSRVFELFFFPKKLLIANR